MQTPSTSAAVPAPAAAPAAPSLASTAVPFGVNEVRLSARDWLVVALIVALVTQLLPRFWERIERFETGPDYRVPYVLSKDYWLYDRRLRRVPGRDHVLLLGDSVVWGEYVLPDGTWSHFLNQESGETNRFLNAGVNGMFPLALEGLVRCYGKSVRRQKVILHCNLLWMTSPKVDLSSEKEEPFNHARLVPQFFPRIPCYKADGSARLTAVVERNARFLAWINHLQNAYFEQKSILDWTLADDGGDPPRYPNAWKNPCAQIGWVVPSAPADDPQRGPKSPRHKPWSSGGTGPTRFDWVDLDQSLQWQAVQRTVRKLQDRGNDVFVVLGPFNEAMMSDENRPAYRRLRDGVARWLSDQQVPHAVPEALPSMLYADASHPLTEGYQLLAKRLLVDAGFRKWLDAR